MTRWINLQAGREATLTGLVRALLSPRCDTRFLGDLIDTADVFSWYGALNSITMATVNTLLPGVPDFYQGCELIDLSRVDPDNRRPVDVGLRREVPSRLQALAEQPDRGPALQFLLSHASDGTVKFWASWHALQRRHANESMLSNGVHRPLEASGALSGPKSGQARTGA